MLRIDLLYALIAAFFAGAAWLNLRERRYAAATFWALLALPCLFGNAVIDSAKAGVDWPAQVMGGVVVALAVLAARSPLRKQVDSAEATAQSEHAASRIGNRLFVPALLIPLVTIVLFYFGNDLAWRGHTLLDPAALTLSALGLACLIALIAAMRVTRSRPSSAIVEGRRLLDSLSWTVLLPMVLATLGSVFAATGVGTAIASMTAALIPIDNRLACLLAFAFGMVLFTVVMGNAFAAFPVMMAGIGLPLLVLRHGADPALLGAVGMLTGYCGTLLTPMAANFNIVPAILLELPDPYDVIRAQVGTAFALMLFNVALMAWMVFR